MRRKGEKGWAKEEEVEWEGDDTRTLQAKCNGA